MIKPELFKPAEVKITYYSSYELYVAGSKARVRTHGLVGIKEGQVVPVEEPGSEPYLIISNQVSKGSNTRLYAVTEENYYHITTSNYWDPLRSTHKPEFKLIEKRNYSKLTTLHQAVAKRVISDYLKNTLKTKSED